MRSLCLVALTLLPLAGALAQDAPATGPERLVWMREHLRGTVSKFEFTQGYDFRKEPERLGPFMAAIKAHGFTAWDQHAAGGIWTEEAFESLERSIVAAEEAGLQVWATLAPPSGCEEIARWPLEQRQEYYYATAERFARIAAEHPSFVAFSCDDFLPYNRAFFSPEMLAVMARRWRAICPNLAFVPLLYYPSITEDFFDTRGEYIDGIVFHYRAESYPYEYIPGYDPKNFEMYGDVMRYELKRVREIAGEHPLICGIYIWYFQRGWGVLTPDEQNPSEEHIVRDAAQKLEIAHEFADGIRVYGLGIDHPAYAAMQERPERWQADGAGWGLQAGDPESHLARWQQELGDGPYLGTLLNSERGFGYSLPRAGEWPRVELSRTFARGEFDPEEAARRFPLLVVSRSQMPPEWPELLRQYAEAGGILALEAVPGWVTDAGVRALEAEELTGDSAPTTLAMAELSGITFHYEPRGFVRRWRVAADHPLTEGLGDPGAWIDSPLAEGQSAYSQLAHPVEATDATVLLEAEHEAAPYDGVAYVPQGEAVGVYPLVTMREVGEGLVVRHYAQNGAGPIMHEAWDRLIENLLKLAEERADE